MKNLLNAAVFLASISPFAANAADYNFSYSFDDSSAITGSLSGDLSGSLITNISNVHVFLNGTQFSGGPLFAAAWNTETGNWDNSTAAVVSTNGSLNNFIFADANVPTDFGVSNYFFFTNDPALGQTVFATNINTGEAAYDSPSTGTWSVTAAPVPLPASLPLLISGLGFLGLAKRRSQKA